MISVPAFLLRKLYVKGSLCNTSQGFQFQLKNILGSGYAKELLPIIVDDEEVPKENCFFRIDEEEIPFSEVSQEKPFTLAMNKTSTLIVKGMTLSPGSHKIGIGFVVQGIGKLSFDIVDSV